MSSINNMDKLIQNVVASFQIDYIEVASDVIKNSKEKVADEYKKEDFFCKKLVKEKGRAYDK